MAAVLEFEDISKQYGGWLSRRPVQALDGFSLRVEPGEIFGFLGPNGAGKTTAIHLALGFMRPDKGTGRLLGHPFGHTRTRRRVGFLAENVALYHRPASRLVRFYGGLNGMGGAGLNQRAREVLELVSLAPEAERNVGTYSRGMLQRIGLAQALVNDPDLLILDEPTSALDPIARVVIRELLLRLKKEGKTVFLSSHLLSEVELVCDRVGVMHRGRLARLGRTAELLQSREQSQVVARGIDVAAFPGAVASDGVVSFTIATANQREVLERIWNLGGEVVSVSPLKRSLEQIFLEVTQPELGRREK
ncbi:MAG TPA: ABC transporter ATP-binding protein [Terriglobales bacterium]|nr:ABC transporter ATP-binding protein [Terriglobales bacterium]